MMKTLIGMTAFILTCVLYATTHAQSAVYPATVVIEYVGKSDRPIFPIIISSSNNEAEWYRKKLFGDPISEFAHIDIVKKAIRKEPPGGVRARLDTLVWASLSKRHGDLMRLRGRIFVWVLFLALSVFSSAQNVDWLPITPQDLNIRQVPGAPGAAAIQLYYAD